MPGWSQPGFDDSQWEPAIRAEDNGSVKAKFYEYRNPAPGGQPKIEGREVDFGFKRPPKLEAFPGVPVRAIRGDQAHRASPRRPTASTSSTWDRTSPAWRG